MAFLGEYYSSFTGQNRIVIPKKIREEIGVESYFTLAKGYDGCLAGYRDADWEKATQELIAEPAVAGRGVDLKRHLFSSAIHLEIDKQGRVVVPPNLLEYAGLGGMKEVVVIGVGNHFEIWEPTLWRQYQKTVEEKINKEKE